MDKNSRYKVVSKISKVLDVQADSFDKLPEVMGAEDS